MVVESMSNGCGTVSRCNLRFTYSLTHALTYLRRLCVFSRPSGVRPKLLTHHMRQISGAAVMTDAANIEKEIIKLKITHASRAQ